MNHPSLDDLRRALLAKARRDCCDVYHRPCSYHSTYDDGLCAMMEAILRVGPLSTDEFLSLTTYDEPLYGLTEAAYQLVAKHQAEGTE